MDAELLATFLTKATARISLHGINRELPMSALGQKRTWQCIRVMSALPPKADIHRRERHVRFVPGGDLSRCSNVRELRLLYHLIGSHEQTGWHCQAERLCGLEVEHRCVLDRRLDRQFSGLCAPQDTVHIQRRLPI